MNEPREPAPAPPGAPPAWRRRRRGTSCLSDLRLDQLLGGELTPRARAEADAHVAACPACASARDALGGDRARFAAREDLARLAADALARAHVAAPAGRSPWAALRRWLLPLGVAGAVGAALLATPGALAPGRQAGRPTAEGTRTKGGFSLSAEVLHVETGARARHAGEPLHPGDRLQLRVSSPEPGHLAVVGVDETRAVSVYFPSGPAAQRVEAGREVALPTAVELDDVAGAETIVALRCPGPVPVAAIVAAATRGAAAAGPRLEAPLAGLPAGCVEARYTFTKERPRGR